MTTTAPPPPTCKGVLDTTIQNVYDKICQSLHGKHSGELKKQQYKYTGKRQNKTEKKQVHFQRKLESKPETELHQSN